MSGPNITGFNHSVGVSHHRVSPNKSQSQGAAGASDVQRMMHAMMYGGAIAKPPQHSPYPHSQSAMGRFGMSAQMPPMDPYAYMPMRSQSPVSQSQMHRAQQHQYPQGGQGGQSGRYDNSLPRPNSQPRPAMSQHQYAAMNRPMSGLQARMSTSPSQYTQSQYGNHQLSHHQHSPRGPSISRTQQAAVSLVRNNGLAQPGARINAATSNQLKAITPDLLKELPSVLPQSGGKLSPQMRDMAFAALVGIHFSVDETGVKTNSALDLKGATSSMKALIDHINNTDDQDGLGSLANTIASKLNRANERADAENNPQQSRIDRWLSK